MDFSISKADRGAGGSSQTKSVSSSPWIIYPRTSAKILSSLGLAPIVDISASISNKTAAFSSSGTSSGNLSLN